jgi:hypothetical protein
VKPQFKPQPYQKKKAIYLPPSPGCTFLKKAKASLLLTEGPISPRLKDVAGSTEALDKGSNTFTAASPSPQGAQEGAQYTLHH